ncbi:hypothetical protein SK128_011003 [Halocaridina rubra]|uniref:Uncharacterized protein n=1 Tax=Halocaridina rubra TaxID=373956 RepID=A0AAN8WMU5_HALRR
MVFHFCETGKARARSHLCPECRQPSNAYPEEHPTNYAILDFLKERDDDDQRGQRPDTVNTLPIEFCELSFEDQMQIAHRLSLEANQEEEKRREAEKKRFAELKQIEENDRLFAEHLQEEEERLLAFRQHEDTFEKSRTSSMNNEIRTTEPHGSNSRSKYPENCSYDSSGSFGDNEGLGNTDAVHDNESSSSDSDIYDDCHAVLRQSKNNNERGALATNVLKEPSKPSHFTPFSGACYLLTDGDQKDNIIKNEADDNVKSPKGTSYTNAQLMLDDICQNEYGSSDVECVVSNLKQEKSKLECGGEKFDERDNICNKINSPSSQSLHQLEKEYMMELAEDTYRKDKELRSALREQEDIELAKALSLSMEQM